MFKPGVMFRNSRIVMMIIGLGLSGWANGAEVQWTPSQNDAGFTIVLPSINIDELVNDVVTLKVALKHDEKRLSHRVEQRRFTTNESLLSLLLPGGMIYAAYKKSSHAQAVSEHEKVVAQLSLLSEDLAVLTSHVETIVVAKR